MEAAARAFWADSCRILEVSTQRHASGTAGVEIPEISNIIAGQAVTAGIAGVAIIRTVFADES